MRKHSYTTNRSSVHGSSLRNLQTKQKKNQQNKENHHFTICQQSCKNDSVKNLTDIFIAVAGAVDIGKSSRDTPTIPVSEFPFIISADFKNVLF